MFSPDSNLRLLNVRFDSELRSTLWFPDRDTQTSWFLSQSDNIQFNDITYIKKDNAIVLGCREEDVWRFNYVMYQNTNFSSKWFYAFIVKREWASDYSVKFYLQTDPIQTWMFDWSLMTSFIERQHSTTDTPGDNIIPEPVGGSTTIYQQAGSYDASPGRIHVYATQNPDGSGAGGSMVTNDVYSACSLVEAEPMGNAEVVGLFLNEYVKNGTASAVARIQTVPFLPGVTSARAVYSPHPDNVDGYVPRNKKILSGVFIKGYLTAYGQETEFIPEFCNGDVEVRAAIEETTGSVYFYVSNYGAANSESNTGSLGFVVTIPESQWAYNQYKNDYNLHNGSNAMFVERSKLNRTVRSINAGIGAIGSAAGIAGNIVDLMNPIQAITDGFSDDITGLAGNAQNLVNSASSLYENFSGIDEISQNLAAIDESYNAPAVGQVAASNPFLAAGITRMKWGWKVPDARFAERYDQFLDVYGYAQNAYSIPNLHAREAWTYVKVTELMLDGNCPDEDELRIKNAFRKGIFFWAYDHEYGNFSQSNNIV